MESNHVRKYRFGYIIVFLFIATFSSLFFYEENFIGTKVEKDVFSFYTISMIEDGDLNIIDQVPDSMSWLVTKTFNHPDVRENGIFSLNWPFYIVARTFSVFVGSDSYKRINLFDFAQTAANVFYLLLGFFFCIKTLELYFKNKHVLGSVALIYFGTPLFYYSFFEYSAIEIHSFFISSLIVYSLVNSPVLIMKKYKYLVIGLLWSVGTIVKAHVFFLVFFVAAYLYFHFSLKVFFKKLFIFFFGAIPVFLLNSCNHYFQWGFYSNPYIHFLHNYVNLFESKFNIDLFFGRNGYFTTSPLIFIALLAPIFCFKYINNKVKKFIFSAFVFFVITYVSNSVRPLQEELFSARAQTVYAVFYLFFISIVFNIANQRLRYLFLALGVMSTLFHVGQSYLYFMESAAFHHTKYFDFLIYNKIAKKIFIIGAHILQNDWLNTIIICFSIAALIGFGLYKVLDKVKITTLSLCLSLFILISYFLGSIMNFTNNEINIKRLKNSGFYADKVVGGGMSIYLYDDMLSVIPKFYKVALDTNSNIKTEEVDKLKNKYIKDISGEILADPINFKKDLVEGRIRPSHWDKAEPL